MSNLPTTTVNSNDFTPFQVMAVVIPGILGIFTFMWWRKKNKQHMDVYADCMVDTYFYGYLRKIIPDIGQEGLKDRIDQYKLIQGLSDEEFPFSKLFIIVPSSGYIPKLLNNFDRDGRIELRKEIDSVKLSRAGVEDRIYKTSVYKIKFRGNHKHFTVVMEGAPPVLCLFETCKENRDLNKCKRKIIHLFYTKLKDKLSKTPEFEDGCEVIYHEDELDRRSLADELIMKYLDSSDVKPNHV